MMASADAGIESAGKIGKQEDKTEITVWPGIFLVLEKTVISRLFHFIQLLLIEVSGDVLMGKYPVVQETQAFFQLNRFQAERICGDVRELIKDRKKLIVEAYCGIGAISLYLHDKAERIIGIEVIEKAVADAEENARLNHIENVRFVCGDASEQVRRILKKEKADLLVVDPPRTGLDEELIATILKAKIKEVIYISCNLATLGKNLQMLKQKYEITSIRGYDMFPNTSHVECACLLTRKN